ncbi:hypothetical protein A2899_02930 [Candidatus Amesbacteria bacterium RIFCSPLOWO2_01_FULL_49_25]|nr:MAG: hypothetical protein A2899_02930 [Candidatus Amesbacteria bacterium RIFCSPLOWO2_01_FULL_49_25]
MKTRPASSFLAWPWINKTMKERLTPIEKINIASEFAKNFVQRWDLKAIQRKDGSYLSIKHPLTHDDILDHLKGEITLGAYVLNPDSMAHFTVMDADDETNFSGLIGVSMVLMARKIPSYIEESRRGGHLWMFFDPMDGWKARSLGNTIAEKFGVTCEVFPKQDKLGEGPGSLIRLPFGVHQKTGKRYGFIDRTGNPLAPTLLEQLKILSYPEKVQLSDVESYLPTKKPVNLPGNSIQEGSGTSWSQIKEKINIKDFIGQYVELRSSGGGAMGKCPFHDDTHNSFGVNEKGNYWHCFAGCGGGSVIDFYMKLKGVDFKTAVEDLRQWTK